jgi:hypothetical protein
MAAAAVALALLLLLWLAAGRVGLPALCPAP